MLIRNGIVVLRAHFIGIREVSLTLRPEDETTVHTWHDNSEERDAASRVKAESRIRMVMGNSLGMMATRMNSQIATESWELGDRIRRLEILYIRRSLDEHTDSSQLWGTMQLQSIIHTSTHISTGCVRCWQTLGAERRELLSVHRIRNLAPSPFPLYS